jgi:hypothetical protein
LDDIKNCGNATQIQVSDDGKTASCDPASGIVSMPGGCKKFVPNTDPRQRRRPVQMIERELYEGRLKAQPDLQTLETPRNQGGPVLPRSPASPGGGHAQVR